MKDVCIISYEGTVKINDVPNCITERRLIDEARLLLQAKKCRPLTNLSNVAYYKNDEIYERFSESFEFYGYNSYAELCDVVVDWEDIK